MMNSNHFNNDEIAKLICDTANDALSNLLLGIDTFTHHTSFEPPQPPYHLSDQQIIELQQSTILILELSQDPSLSFADKNNLISKARNILITMGHGISHIPSALPAPQPSTTVA